MPRRRIYWSLFLVAILGVPLLTSAFAPNNGITSISSVPVSPPALSMTALTTEYLARLPTELNSLQVVTICMSALQKNTANEALAICFHFSSDRCRAAVGGTLEEFMRYADSPVFGTLVNCDDYEMVSIGEIIPGASFGLGSRRGEMQTFLVEIKEGMSLKTVKKAADKQARRRPTIEERLRQRELRANGEMKEGPEDIMEEKVDDGKRRFLWTLQKEVRPPRQDCWLVHEVLFTKNAINQTM